MFEIPDFSKKIWKFLLGFFVGFIAFFACTFFLNTEQALIIGSIAFLVTLWTNEALSMGVVSLFPLILFPIFGILDFNDIAPKYSSPIIFLFIGGFLLALAVEKTGLHKIIAGRLMKLFPDTPRGAIYALAVTSAMLSAILSNTTITLMLLPVALGISKELKLKKRFLIAVAYGASIGGILTPLGTPPNLIMLGFLETKNIAAPTFMQWILLMLPLVALMLLIVPFLLSLGIKKEQSKLNLEKSIKMNTEQKKLAAILIILLFTLLLNSPIGPSFPGLGLNEKILLLGFGLFMFFPGINYLEWKDVSKLPFQIVFLFGAGFTIADAFSASGIIEPIAAALSSLSALPIILLFFLVALIVSFATEITSNTALISIVLPVFFAFVALFPAGDISMLLVPTIAASYAFMLPIATPPNAIVMSSDELKVKDMARIGVFVNIMGVVLLTLVAYFYWSYFSFF